MHKRGGDRVWRLHPGLHRRLPCIQLADEMRPPPAFEYSSAQPIASEAGEQFGVIGKDDGLRASRNVLHERPRGASG